MKNMILLLGFCFSVIFSSELVALEAPLCPEGPNGDIKYDRIKATYYSGRRPSKEGEIYSVCQVKGQSDVITGSVNAKGLVCKIGNNTTPVNSHSGDDPSNFCVSAIRGGHVTARECKIVCE